MINSKFNIKNSKGFTLIEILIATAVSGIVMIALYQTFNSQQKSYVIQEDVANMQQNARVAMLFMTNDIRMAGYDRFLTGNFGIVDINTRDTSNSTDTDGFTGIRTTAFAGNSSIVMTIDYSDEGTLDANETIHFQVYDFDAADSHFDLARKIGGATNRLLAENVRKMGLAYAFDENLDGQLDTYNVGGTPQIIWAIDTNGDNTLDTNLDTNSDGVIDIADGPGGVDTVIVGQPLKDFTGIAIPDVPTSEIRAVRIWILTQTDRIDPNLPSNSVYVVGQYIVEADSRRMRLLTTTVKCRNMGI